MQTFTGPKWRIEDDLQHTPSGRELIVPLGKRVLNESSLRKSLAVISIVAGFLACALQAQVPISQMYHRSWTVRDGAPNNIEDAKQDREGFLWLSTDDGLYRFDGVVFQRYEPPSGQSLLSERLNAVMIAHDGSVWISYMLGGISRIQGRQLTNFTTKDGLRSGHIGSLAEDAEGRVWAIGTGGLQYIRDNRVTQFHGAHGEGDMAGEMIVVDRGGALWSTPYDQGLFVLRAGTSELLQASRDHYYGCTQAHGSGVLCRIGEAQGGRLAYFDANSEPIHPISTMSSSSSLFDELAARDGTIWMAESHGIERFNSNVGRSTPSDSPKHESFRQKDGLSGRGAFTVFEDREGSIWVCTDRGLDQFRAVPFHSVELDELLGALPANGVWPRFLVGTDKLLDLSSGLPKLVEGSRGIEVPRRLLRGDDGTVWIGAHNGLFRYSNDRIASVPLPKGLVGTSRLVQTIVEDSSHALWVTVANNGVYRFGQGKWLKGGGYAEIPDATAYAGLRDNEGTVWLGFQNSLLVRITRNGVTRFDASRGLNTGDVRVMAERSGQLWIGGEKGITLLCDGTFHRLRLRESDGLRGVTGLIFLPDGDLWINGASGVFRIAKSQLLAWDRNKDVALEATRFDYLDGINGVAMILSGNPSLAVARDGRLYVATNSGLQWIDPSQIPTNRIKPSVWITSVHTAAEDVAPVGNEIQINAKAEDLAIGFTAPSLLIPERVRFRYRLEGFDRAWVDPGSVRMAHYSRVPAGSYTFHVIACNDSGVWNETGASLILKVPPTLTERIWFKPGIILTLLAVAIVWFRVRLIATKRRVANQMYDIIAERQRIARDLHDTLLQSVQAIMFKVGIVSAQLPADNPMKSVLEQTLSQSDEVLMDGRRLISNLQVEGKSSDALLNTLSAAVDDLQTTYPEIGFKIHAEGLDRLLNTVVHQEMLTIGREALTNACRHSHAAHVDLLLNVAADSLRLEVRDNGHGIDKEVLERGYRPGHWGLRNMRERTNRLGGRFNVRSIPESGTTIEVIVPAFIAYKDEPRNFREKLRRWFG